MSHHVNSKAAIRGFREEKQAARNVRREIEHSRRERNHAKRQRVRKGFRAEQHAGNVARFIEDSRETLKVETKGSRVFRRALRWLRNLMPGAPEILKAEEEAKLLGERAGDIADR
jgi:hypothetical protein